MNLQLIRSGEWCAHTISSGINYSIPSRRAKDKNNILLIDIYSGDVVRPLGHNEHVTHCPSQLITPRTLTHQWCSTYATSLNFQWRKHSRLFRIVIVILKSNLLLDKTCVSCTGWNRSSWRQPTPTLLFITYLTHDSCLHSLSQPTRFIVKSVKWAVPVSLLYCTHAQVEPALGKQPNPVRNVNWKGLEILKM